MVRWDRYIAIIGRITQRPEVWQQEQIRCGSAFCVWGHAAVDATGSELMCHTNLEKGRAWLGFDYRETDYVFYYGRTLAELQELAITQKFPWERP